ncbi:ABC transporter permease [uncultured Nitratireductor sp.]|uniref:ABC transporter permease n=1 Tax=uncultured Nitratireductor sp. TaxID=520953 RepID=UPI0025FADB7C|nr:ABC transporter permease [uncultured Nitratireductor sp.]
MTDQTINTTAAPAKDRKEDLYTATPAQLIWRRFTKHILAVVSLWFLVILALCALFADMVAPYAPFEVQRLRTLAPPTGIHLFHEGRFVGPFVYGLSRERDAETARVLYETDPEAVLPIRLFHQGDDYDFFGLFQSNIHLFGVDDRRQQINLLGTDDLGRDIFSRVLYSGRTSLTVGFLVVGVASLIGIFLGLIAGFFRRADGPVSRLIDAMMAFPDILLAIALVAALGPSAANVVLALGIVYAPRLARVVRASTLVIRELPYVEAARALAVPTPVILVRHVLRNVTSPLLVQATFIFAQAILAEAGLSFLGVGISPDIPTWGTMISIGRQFMSTAEWIMLFPGLAIVITVLALQLLGDGLRDLLDPRLAKDI